MAIFSTTTGCGCCHRRHMHLMMPSLSRMIIRRWHSDDEARHDRTGLNVKRNSERFRPRSDRQKPRKCPNSRLKSRFHKRFLLYVKLRDLSSDSTCDWISFPPFKRIFLVIEVRDVRCRRTVHCEVRKLEQLLWQQCIWRLRYPVNWTHNLTFVFKLK